MLGSQTPWVVLDSTALNANDWYLDRLPARLLLRECRQRHLRLAVPEVVMVECAAAHEREARDTFQKMIDLHRTLSALRARPSPITSPHIAYRTDLEGILTEAGATILPLPDVSHVELVHRAANRRKPFDSKGDGYRDALIWSSVLELVQASDDPVALISNDRAAFAEKTSDKKPKLDADLSAELASAGRQGAVRLFFTLGEYIDSLGLPPDAEVLAHWEHRLSHEVEFRTSLLSAIEQAVSDQALDPFWLAEVGTNEGGYAERLQLSDVRHPRVRTALVEGGRRSVELVVFTDYVLEGVSLPLDPSGRPSRLPPRSIMDEGTAELTIEVREDSCEDSGFRITVLRVAGPEEFGDDTDLPGFQGWTEQGTQSRTSRLIPQPVRS